MDKKAGTLVVDRFLYTSMRYPGNYGFIPHTLSGDGDSVDVLIANQRGIVPGAVVACRPIGVLKMQDEAGVDEKIVAVPVSPAHPPLRSSFNYSHLPDITVQQIEHFFDHYKDLEPQSIGRSEGIVAGGNARESRGNDHRRHCRAKKGMKIIRPTRHPASAGMTSLRAWPFILLA